MRATFEAVIALALNSAYTGTKFSFWISTVSIQCARSAFALPSGQSVIVSLRFGYAEARHVRERLLQAWRCHTQRLVGVAPDA
jgi:hypothetical protein